MHHIYKAILSNYVRSLLKNFLQAKEVAIILDV